MPATTVTQANEIRVANMQALARQRGGVTRLSEQMGYKGTYLPQLIGPRPQRTISEKSARDMERRLDLPVGYLDVDRRSAGEPAPAADVGDMLRKSVQAVALALAEAQAQLPPEKHGDLVVLVYDISAPVGAVDDKIVQRLVRLAVPPDADK